MSKIRGRNLSAKPISRYCSGLFSGSECDSGGEDTGAGDLSLRFPKIPMIGVEQWSLGRWRGGGKEENEERWRDEEAERHINPWGPPSHGSKPTTNNGVSNETPSSHMVVSPMGLGSKALRVPARAQESRCPMKLHYFCAKDVIASSSLGKAPQRVTVNGRDIACSGVVRQERYLDGIKLRGTCL